MKHVYDVAWNSHMQKGGCDSKTCAGTYLSSQELSTKEGTQR